MNKVVTLAHFYMKYTDIFSFHFIRYNKTMKCESVWL